MALQWPLMEVGVRCRTIFPFSVNKRRPGHFQYQRRSRIKIIYNPNPFFITFILQKRHFFKENYFSNLLPPFFDQL